MEEEQYYQSQLPGSPISLLHLMASTSTQIDVFSDGVISEVKEGSESALKVLIQLRAMQKATERILKEINENILTEADKYPGNEFSFLGNKIKKEDVYTSYDYSICDDTIFERLEADFEKAKVKLEERKAFLKTLKESMTIVDESTGEVIKVKPPFKKSIAGLKVMIR